MKTTGFSRVSKEKIISEIEKELKAKTTFFVTRHDTVSADKMDKLRAKLRGSKARYFTVKNTLGKKALERAKIQGLDEHMAGGCGFTFTQGDPVPASKTLVEFAKANESFKVQAGWLEGKLVSKEQVQFLASLPSREVMLARVVGGMQAPISGFVGVLAGTLRKVVTALDAIAKKKGNG